jgi:long-chain acyl-CoA synthetase
MDPENLSPSTLAQLTESNPKIRFYNFSEIEKLGLEQPMKDFLLLDPVDPDSPSAIKYTSGSTGVPKGVIVSGKAWNADIVGTGEYLYDSTFFTLIFFRRNCAVDFFYEPLAHATRRNYQYVLSNGGRFAIFSGEMGQEFFKELSIIRPTSLAGAPRIWNVLYSEYKKLVMLYSEGIHTKEIPQVEKACAEIISKDVLGGRIRFEKCRKCLIFRVITTGGAPTSPEVITFLKRLGCAVFDSYGITESGSIR